MHLNRARWLMTAAWMLLPASGFMPAIRAADRQAAAAAMPRETGPHWSLRPLREPAVPRLQTNQGAGWARNEVDAFIARLLAEKGLKPAPAADRATLIRRMSFDLTGLPPSPDAVEAFVKDRSPGAVAALVDRLLASPQHGERWGRHWLDLARYSESQGFEYDRLRENAWHYRDYAVHSFNFDKPYSQFVREQIAGDALEPFDRDAAIGASFLVCGSWDEAGNSQANATQKAITREDELEDVIGAVSQTFLGLTVNCARCHNHKFDPISLDEYYRVKSVFEGVKHGERQLAPPAEVLEHEARAAAIKAAVETAKKEGRTAPVASIPPLPVSYIGKRVQPEPTKRLRRGDVKSPGERVTPGGLAAIAGLNADFGLPADAPEAERRRRFVAWLLDARNPLPARVMANRIWQWHFGQGLVTTPNDFGASGSPPSHPELLDWLALRLIESGGSVKALHRLIVNSATYQQSSAFDPAAAAIDAEAQWLWRFPPRRLEAEAVRDAILAVAGTLNPRMGGPSARPFEIQKFPQNAYVPFDQGGPEYDRRTVYRMNVNSGKDPLLDSFDCPDPGVKAPRRGTTTTPLQALELMNSSFVQRQSAALAARAAREGGAGIAAPIDRAYRLALGRPPTRSELARASTVANERGLHSVCWALLNSTEFVYLR